MATTEERLAALEAKMAQLTDTTPTTYYTHQYSGEEIDAAVGRAVTGGALDTSVTNVSNQLGTFVRPNLLDNWYFGNPVNQRGQTEYTSNVYAVDRWLVEPGMTLKIANDGVVLESAGTEWWSGLLEKKECSLPARTTITFSVLGKFTGDARLFLGTGGNDELKSNYFPPSGGWECFSVTATLESATNMLAVRVSPDTKNVKANCTLLAAKLELGPTQTLAHREGDRWVLNEIPDYGEQLRRCQRYRIAYGQYAQWGAVDIQTDYIDFSVYLPVTMRALPSIDGASNLRVNGYSDFVFSVATFNGNNLRIRATKSNHGLASAFLEAAEKIAFTSDL